MTHRFHHCLRKMERRQLRNIAFNVLLAIATPKIKLLKAAPNVKSESPCWQRSSLKNCGNADVNLVWIPKENTTGNFVGIIEAHFAGTLGECNNFIQMNPIVPAHGACKVKRDLSGLGLHSIAELTTPAHTHGIEFYRWYVTDELQNAVIDDIGELPEGQFCLDKQQESILEKQPPLLLESRSGTGEQDDHKFFVVEHNFYFFFTLYSHVTPPIPPPFCQEKQTCCFSMLLLMQEA